MSSAKYLLFISFRPQCVKQLPFAEATVSEPREVKELHLKNVVGIAMGPHTLFPNAYVHLEGRYCKSMA